MDYKSILIPSILTGIVSGCSYLLANLSNMNLTQAGYATIIAAVLTGVVAGAQYFFEKNKSQPVSISCKDCEKKSMKLFLGQK